MIISFGHKQTEKIWNGERDRKIPLEIQKIGRRKFRMLNNSQNINDLGFHHPVDWKNCQDIKRNFIVLE